MTAVDIHDALAALEAAGVRWCVRNAPERVADVPPGGDVDIIVDESQLTTVHGVLASCGFHAFAAPGHRGHTFFIDIVDGRWIKLDVMVDAAVLARRSRVDDMWVASADDQARHGEERAAGRPPLSLRARIARLRPLGARRSGPVVAVLGPDGAGKGTIIDALVQEIPVGVTVARMGTARSGPAAETPAPRSSAAREIAFVTRKWARSMRRLMPAYGAAWRGHIVLCDRHPLEVLAVRPDRRPLAQRWERWLLTKLIARPDAVIVLDAPSAVLVARKPEHPFTVIEEWRDGYRGLPAAHIIDTDQPPERSIAVASQVVFDALARRRGWVT